MKNELKAERTQEITKKISLAQRGRNEFELFLMVKILISKSFKAPISSNN